LFGSLSLEVKPAKHTPATALPWVCAIAAYTGMCLEEITQLTVGDIRDVGANGSTVTVIDIHNGGNNALKNAASARLVPVHSALVRAGLLRYPDALPKDGPLFPGLERRASKGGKIGCRVGELFRDKLETLGLKRDRLCFHSFRQRSPDASRPPQCRKRTRRVCSATRLPACPTGFIRAGRA
jgi:integrase